MSHTNMRETRKARPAPLVQPYLEVFRTSEAWGTINGKEATEWHFHALRIGGPFRLRPHCLCDRPRNTRGKRRHVRQ